MWSGQPYTSGFKPWSRCIQRSSARPWSFSTLGMYYARNTYSVACTLAGRRPYGAPACFGICYVRNAMHWMHTVLLICVAGGTVRRSCLLFKSSFVMLYSRCLDSIALSCCTVLSLSLAVIVLLSLSLAVQALLGQYRCFLVCCNGPSRAHEFSFNANNSCFKKRDNKRIGRLAKLERFYACCKNVPPIWGCSKLPWHSTPGIS